MNYYALHFHMKSSGVKIVIENLMKAFSSYTKTNFTLLESGKQTKYQSPIKIKHVKIPELNYEDRYFDSYNDLEKKAINLMKKIEKVLDLSEKCVLHVHNANLFKNSYLPIALRLLAEAHPKDILLLLQVHDFAEEHRPDRVHLLLNCTGKKDQKIAARLAYPIAANIVYLTINSRDKRLLKNIGIPDERIFVFANAVNTEFFVQKPIKEERLLDLIEKYATKHGYIFSKKRKILLYPVKLIRRKNVVETILILKLLNSIKDEYQLLITLDASTKDDIKYSDDIKRYIKKNKLPVTIGFGFEIISPNEKRKIDSKGNITEYTLVDLFSHSESILTTSAREGFGFAFIEGWLAKKQVVGRKLWIQDDFEKEGIKFPGFYKHIMVKGKDFVSYPYKEQLKLLDKINMKKVLKQEDIKSFLDAIKKPNTKVIMNNKKIIIDKYSLKGYLERLENIIKISSKLTNKTVKAEINNRYLIDYFSTDKEKLVIITDMDGTFLDNKAYTFRYSFDIYKKAIKAGIPVCFCTSKSYPEMPYFIEKLGERDPMILENGSAVYVPKGYFSFDIRKMDWSRDYGIRNISEYEDYDVFELNVSHKETYGTLKQMQKELSFPIFIYTDHTDAELEKYTGMPEDMARISKKKFYADGCRIPDLNSRKLKEFSDLALKYGYETKKGDLFIGINKGCDKGKATQILLELFENEYKRILSIGIGNSNNDLPMLKVVDFGFLVANDDGSHTNADNLEKIDEIASKGWSIVVNSFLERY